MNRLFNKLKDFGIIFSLESKTENEIIRYSKALKKSDMPLALFPYRIDQKIDAIKISNENEDMFLGALCSSNYSEVKKAIASGSHFIVCDFNNKEEIKKCLNEGYEIILQVHSIDEIKDACSNGVEAILINCRNSGNRTLIDFAISNTEAALFLQGDLNDIPIEEYGNHKNFVAAILNVSFENKTNEEIQSKAHQYLHQILGLHYSFLELQKDSERLEDAKVFAALTAIPLFENCDRDLLTLTVRDMDRTIAHLKWKNIYMDPLSAKMDGSIILETELYTDFLGWKVKLINGS